MYRFVGMSVILYTEDSKRDGFKRLLEAGGATVTIGPTNAVPAVHVCTAFAVCLVDFLNYLCLFVCLS